MTEKLPQEVQDALNSTVNAGVKLDELSPRFQAMVLGLTAFQKLKRQPEDES